MRFLFFLLLFSPILAQDNPNTEIFLFDLELDYETILIKNGKNISQNSGYDNQPSFYFNDTILYSGTRKGQTDIAGYSLKKENKFWLSNTGEGSEYSPKGIPGSFDLAAVRLDTTGLQRLYRYQAGGKNEVLLQDLKIGYFFFFNETTLVTAVLSGTGMDLVINDLKTGSSEVVIKNIGRSIHKIPDSDLISYTILNEQNDLDLYILDMEKPQPESFFLTSLPSGVLDYAWLDQDRILIGMGTQIFLYDMLGDSEWTMISDLSDLRLENISRIAVSPDRTKIALTAELP